MRTQSDFFIRMYGRRYDLVSRQNLIFLLKSRTGRRTIVKWLNKHRDSGNYLHVYNEIAGLTGDATLFLNPFIAGITATTFVLSSFSWHNMPNSAYADNANLPGNKFNSHNIHEISKQQPGELVFTNTNTRGYGIEKVEELNDMEGGQKGKIIAKRLLFRNEKGMRLICELGRYAPAGAEIVFGNRTYRMIKNGVAWNMRNITGINDRPVPENIFIAEKFVGKSKYTAGKQGDKIVHAAQRDVPVDKADNFERIRVNTKSLSAILQKEKLGYAGSKPEKQEQKKNRLVMKEQGNIIEQRSQDNIVELYQKRQDWLIPSHKDDEVPAKEDKKEDKKDGVGQFLGVAWRYFNSGDYKNAVKIFSTISSSPESMREAKYGLAMSYSKLKDTEKALPLLEALAKKKLYLKDVLPALMSLLMEKGDIENAVFYAGMFGEKDKRKWEEEIRVKALSGAFEIAKKQGDIEGLKGLVDSNGGLLNKCLAHGIFVETANLLLKTDDKYATDIYRGLLRSCPDKWDLRLGIFYSMKTISKPADMLIELKNEESRKELDAGYSEKLSGLKVSVLKEIFAGLKPDSPEFEKVLNEILALSPEDSDALSALAWRDFRNEQYEEAYKRFSALYGSEPENDYAEGMIYALMKLKRFDEALEVVGSHKDNEKIASMGKDIRMKMLWDKVSALASDSPELEGIAREMLSINPDEEGIRDILAWWYYNKDDYEKAYDEFNALFNRNPLTKGYSFGLASSLVKLNRADEALEIVVKNKKNDERLAALEAEIYLDKARAAYRDKKYGEAETYSAKALAQNPQDTETRELLELSRYRQTLPARAMSAIVGLPGFTWGNITNSRTTGTGISFLVNQGIDWVKLPGDIIFNTFAEYRYRSRSKDNRYFDEQGQAVGFELKKSIFRLGAEYSWDRYVEQKSAYLAWYDDWYKYMKKRGEEGGFPIEGLSGETYGKISHDLENTTGTSISGHVNQGIDWFTLPGDIVFNTYAEYRFSFRTKDNLYYNAHGPAVGVELQKKPFRIGMDYYWETGTKRHATDKKLGVYLRWYYDWDLKPEKLK